MNDQTNHPETPETPDSQPSLRDTYRMLADAGFGLIRVVANDKRPEGTWADQSGTAWLTADQAVTRLESRTGNVGIVPRGDCIVIDFDGDDAIDRFDQECKKSPRFETFAVQTPNGFHVYCRVKDPELIHVSTGKSNWGSGVDIRSARANSQVVGPGSYVKATKPEKQSGSYMVICDAPIAYAPEHIEHLCRQSLKMRANPSPNPPANQSPPQDASNERAIPKLPTCRNKVSEARRHIRNAKRGERNATISKYAPMAGMYACHYPDELSHESTYSKLHEDVESILTPDDSPEERARHFETLERQFQYGWDNPHYVESNDGSSKKDENPPSRFILIMNDMGWHCRYNIELGENQFMSPDSKFWQTLTRLEIEQLFAQIWDSYGWKVNQQDRKTLLAHVCMQNSIRPVREYLLACKPDPDMSHITLENWLADWLDNPDGRLDCWAAKALIVGIVYRIMEGDKAQRYHVILRGPGNCGKSTIVQNLLFPEFDMTGDLNLNDSDRNIISQLSKNFVVEWSEIRANFQKDKEKCKSFLGAGAKSLRNMYTDSTVTKRRYNACVIGTTNPAPVLADDEALISRMVILPVHRNDDKDPGVIIPKIRKHLFGLGMKAYYEGFDPNILPSEYIEDQFTYAAPSVIRESRFEDAFNSIQWTMVPVEFTKQEIAAYMGLARNPKEFARNKQLDYAIEKILINNGFTGAYGFSDYYYWKRPENSEESYPLPIEDISKRKRNERTIRASKAYDQINNPNPFNHTEPKDIDLDDLESATQPPGSIEGE